MSRCPAACRRVEATRKASLKEKKQQRWCLQCEVCFSLQTRKCLPKNFLGSQTLKVSAHRVKPLKCGLHTQGAKEVFWAHFVKVKGDTSNVSPSARLVIDLRFVHK